MRTGIHLPPQGATARAIATAAALDAACLLWLAMDTNGPHKPGDAVRFPSAVHLVRLPNPGVQEAADAYVRRVEATVTMWRAALPDAYYVIGNEPEQEAGWPIDAWLGALPLFAAMVRGRFPGIRLAATPFLAANAARMTAEVAAAFDAVCCHSYWGFEAPANVADPQWGRNYLPLLAYGKDVFVSEVNASPVNRTPTSAADWHERNRQIAEWIAQADGDGVKGCCIFLADGEGQWSGFDVGPEAAADILAQIPVPPPPPAPPEPTPTGYTGASVPLNHAALHPDWYAHAPKEVADAYAQYAPVIGYDPNLAIAQSAIETGRWTSPAYINRRNMAGVGITGDSVLGPTWDTVAQGVQAHLALLNCYYGDGTDPWGQLTRFGFGGFTLGKHTLNDMNGVWAVPGTVYGQSIAATANEVTGGVVPAPGPQPTPAQQYQIVTPVDCPVMQGSDGAFSHGGRVPGFYAMDYGCVRGTPCRASADGTVGVIYTTDWNPISARTGPSIWIDHDNGYSTFSCHMSRIDVATGGRVTQGQIIGLTGDPAIDGGFGDGAHLHWEIHKDGVRVKAEDLEAAGIMGPYDPTFVEDESIVVTVDGHIDDGRLDAVWYGKPTPTKTQLKTLPRVKGHGIPDRWEQEFRAKKCLGQCLTKEMDVPDNSGAKIQYFANGWIVWYPADGSTTVN